MTLCKASVLTLLTVHGGQGAQKAMLVDCHSRAAHNMCTAAAAAMCKAQHPLCQLAA